ncbi:MAG: Crp/Fnr family transcriptional regulator [Lautropia sp.]
MPQSSCLVSKFSHYLNLTSQEEALVRRLEQVERPYRTGDVVRSEGAPVQELFVVKRGWVAHCAHLGDGRRQVFDLQFPGDVVGTRDIVFDRASVTLTAATDLVLCPFPKRALDVLFERVPRIGALLFSFVALDNVVVFDRLRAVARMQAANRLGFFLLQIRSRLRITDRAVGDEFELPLGQALIGDALGLSQVHVNRTFRELEAQGLVERTVRGRVRLDSERLTRFADFSDRHYRIDTSWFPGPGDRAAPAP